MAKIPEQAVIKRTRDINKTVRKAAFIFISKITVKSLTIKQRVTLLADGLNDPSDGVRRVASNILLPSWLQHFKPDFVNLLRPLGAEMAIETATVAFNTLFKQTDKNKLLAEIPLDQETKVIPLDKLTGENILFWKYFVVYLY